ncbi:DNA polymerase beta domain protein region [Halothece sp. PCC 7418]|uniref:nucleotidyltransferase family protein n=1 Tax=Halothece sp. (strain PCC 7418) TaxID=65093 RepID=UPI0002A07630|nr:nucleotidyltransferase [Halothece sp. PCC 7418]AFZ43447.1 DNA polymerase beta domain protein region [Halothece sp. PCC 7418]
MTLSLEETIQILKAHESELRDRGVAHLAVFGSVSRGEAQENSDIDLLVELNSNSLIGLFEYADLKLYLQSLFNDPADVANRSTLKPFLKDAILSEAVRVF